MQLRSIRLFVWLSVYYGAVTLIAVIAQNIYPALSDFLPLGGAQQLLGGPNGNTLEPLEIYATQIQNFSGSLAWLVFAVLGAIATVLPVTWVYMEVRNRHDYDQSLVETILILPIAVTSVVVIVQNSLALAFSLAGVVGAVRFRNTLKSSGDALYILLAIGIGLAAGTSALEIAIVMTVIFNYTFLVLWTLDYGARGNGHRYMRPSHKRAEAPANPEEKS
ncbi:MAG: DUF4956 domain-containing protein [Alphaproteobacteria bacterium]|nr:MAG: DUF4956 domain-containing protein [Alphaproteobacteria bacterium]